MKDNLSTALNALQLDRLRGWRNFCARQHDRGGPPGREVWHALTIAADEALDHLEDQQDAFDRMFNDDDGETGEQITGPLDLDGWIAE